MGLFNFLSKKTQHGNHQIDCFLSNFSFESNCHQRYENGKAVMGLQFCPRYLKIKQNVDGCPGYKLNSNDGFILYATNGDTGKSQFFPKPMRIVKHSDSVITLQGYRVSAQGPFGWQEIDLSNYIFTIYLNNWEIVQCELTISDKNVKLLYMKKAEIPSHINTNKAISIKDIANGDAFVAHFSRIKIIKQAYNGQKNDIPVDNHASIDIIRQNRDGILTITISTISELSMKGILSKNPSFTPYFNYMERDNGSVQFAQAIINNAQGVWNGGISNFSISRQNEKLVAFIIVNLPYIDDYYYLIVFEE